MRTFNKVKYFGAGPTGATGGKNNEAVLIRSTATSGVNTITLHCFDTTGGTVGVGPLVIGNRTATIFPMKIYGFTGSTSGIEVWELF